MGKDRGVTSEDIGEYRVIYKKETLLAIKENLRPLFQDVDKFDIPERLRAYPTHEIKDCFIGNGCDVYKVTPISKSQNK